METKLINVTSRWPLSDSGRGKCKMGSLWPDGRQKIDERIMQHQYCFRTKQIGSRTGEIEGSFFSAVGKNVLTKCHVKPCQTLITNEYFQNVTIVV